MSETSDRAYNKHPRIGVGVVVFQKTRVLLIKRGGEPYKDFWTIPGGMVELGETLEETAKREVFEECGINIHNCRFIDKFEFIIKDENKSIKYHYIVLDYICDFIKGKINAGGDVDDACWFELNELQSLHTTKGTIDLINKAYLSQKAPSD